jgi:hypothetical protein
MSATQKRAGLKVTGAFHILRHTFCSHLAMRGVPPLSIKDLAGHRSLHTTMRYMYLGKGRSTAPFKCWKRGMMRLRLGDILETRKSQKAPGPETAEISAASGPS